MTDDSVAPDSDDLIRYECPQCGKGFDIAAQDKWQSDGVVCPYCGAEIEG